MSLLHYLALCVGYVTLAGVAVVFVFGVIGEIRQHVQARRDWAAEVEEAFER